MVFRIHTQSDFDVLPLSMGQELDFTNIQWGPGTRDRYILHYVLEGRGYFNGMPVSKGQGFFIEKDTLVEYHPDPEEPWQYFWITFKGKQPQLGQCFVDTGLRLENHVFDFSFLPELQKLINDLDFQNRKEISAVKALSVLYTLMAFHEAQNHPEKRLSTADAHIQNAMLYMENNYHRELRIVEVAASIYVDDRYLYNLFMEKQGISPKAYLNQLRIHRACHLLKSTQLSVANIGESVGYTDSLAFSAFFKKQMGVSPRQYRLQEQSEGQG